MESLLENYAKASEKCAKARRNRAIAVRSILANLNGVDKERQKNILSEIAETLPATEMTEAFVKQATLRGIRLKQAASFRAQMVVATCRRQLSGVKPEFVLNDKASGYKFIDKIEIKRPQIFASNKRFADLELSDSVVLKPSSGSSSNGVFIIADSKSITEVKTGEVFDSIDAVSRRIADLIRSKRVQDKWTVEELIAKRDGNKITPARDLKFYTFYGKLGFVLEVERSGKTRYCEWLPSGQLAETGRYGERRFSGSGFSQHNADIALAISSEIPAPFMRIDFLKTDEDFVFCEFTPRPGQFNAFNADFDRYLGELYLDAEARLLEDLLNGKRFPKLGYK